MKMRPYLNKDFDIISRWITDERSHALWCANLIPYPLEKKSFDDLLLQTEERFNDSPFVATTDEGVVVGFFCFSVNLKTNEGMLKFVVIDDTMRNKGYGCEMIKLAVKYAFEIAKADVVQLNVFSENPSAIVIIVTNPVDILTNIAIKMFPKKEQQIFGSGTTLDTARLRFLLGEKMSVNPKSVHAYIVGEHGDSELVLWSTATVGSTALDLFYKLSQKEKQIIFEKAKNSAYAIIAGKQSTYYAIAAALVKLTKSVLFDKKTVYTVSHTADGRFGIHNISLSLPAVIGAKGVIKEPHLKITADEKRLLRQSAAVLNKAEKSLLL